MFFFFKQKTAYEIQFGDWSSDVCSSDLILKACEPLVIPPVAAPPAVEPAPADPPVWASASELVTARAVASPKVASRDVASLMVILLC